VFLRLLCTASEYEVNPLIVFAGFAASVALVLLVVISSIVLYRRTRRRHPPTRLGGAAAVDDRKRAKHDSSRHVAPAGHNVIRLTATDDVRKTSNCNVIRDARADTDPVGV